MPTFSFPNLLPRFAPVCALLGFLVGCGSSSGDGGSSQDPQSSIGGNGMAGAQAGSGSEALSGAQGLGGFPPSAGAPGLGGVQGYGGSVARGGAIGAGGLVGLGGAGTSGSGVGGAAGGGVAGGGTLGGANPGGSDPGLGGMSGATSLGGASFGGEPLTAGNAGIAGDPSQPIVTGPYRWKSVRTGAGGGFIVDVIFNQKERDLIYAKTDMGGVYRWNPASQNWIQLLNWVDADHWGYTGPESVATDPMDPDRLYIAAGTYTNSWDPNNGAILRSTDRGETFEVTPMPFKMGGNMPGRGMGERLAIDPNQNSILYFGAREEMGLWKSTDYGESWTEVTNFPDKGPYAQDPNDTEFDYLNHKIGIPWVILDPATGTSGNPTQTIYVGVAQNESDQPNLYRSQDAGANWEAIPGQPTCTVSGNTVTCTGGASWDMSSVGDDGEMQWNTTGYLPHQGKLDSQGTLYVTYSNFAGPYNGNVGDVWKFEPASGTWTMISPIPGSRNPSDMWWGYGGLAVDMQHPGTLVVSTVNSWWPEGNLFRTTDGGASWIAGWEWTSYPERTIRWTMDISSAPWLSLGVTNPSPPDPLIKVGWMMEGMNIDPFDSDRMMYGTGATLYGTTDLSAWDTGTFTIQSMAVGIEETSVLGLVSPPSGPAHLFSAVGDIGGWRHDDLDTPPGTVHTVPYAGTNNDIDFAESKPEFMVRVLTGDPGTNPPSHGSAFTYDGGENWFQGNSDPVAEKGAGTVAAAADGSRVVWASNDTSVPVSYSTDNGNTWNTCASIPNGATVASDRVNPSKFYGFGEGKFWASTDGGETFTGSAVAIELPSKGRVKAVFGKEGEVWITGGEQISGGSTDCDLCGLWRTTDGGASIVKLASVTRSEAVGFGMTAVEGGPPAVFLAGKVGDTRGIFRSDDAGESWIAISDERHNFATIQTITGDPRIYGRVYLGTNGLGIVYGDIAE